MFCILMDSKTQTYYMKKGESMFHAYSDSSKFEDDFGPSARLVETEYEEFKELSTDLFNAGFTRGYLDGKEIVLSKSDTYFSRTNRNEIAFAQYTLTKDARFLDLIEKQKLVTICKIDGENILFPIVRRQDGLEAVITYTSEFHFPQKLLDMYTGYRVVKMTFKAPCIVNDTFIMKD